MKEILISLFWRRKWEQTSKLAICHLPATFHHNRDRCYLAMFCLFYEPNGVMEKIIGWLVTQKNICCNPLTISDFYCPFTLTYQYWCMVANMKKHKTEVYQIFNDPDNTML